jgi:hypothetical protein
LVDNSRTLRSNKKVKNGMIAFLTPSEDNTYVDLTFEYNDDQIKRLQDLVGVIWKKIMNLDFPDTSSYPPTIKGIRMFEDDLLSGNI